MDYIFKLGFSGKLAELELASVLGYKPKAISESEFLVTLPDLTTLNQIANRLGGLVEVVFADTQKPVWHHSARYWQRVDRDKPFTSPGRGMLPPKIARQMLNLAIGPQLENDKVLLDPFCGSGTILLEGATLGLKVIGADLDRRQLAGAEKNLNWAKAQFKLVLADAVQISQYLDKQVDYIVTEPFMGKTKYRPEEITNITKGLSKLYLGALKNWQKVLASGGKVVMAFPIYRQNEKRFVTGDIVDHKLLSGYNVLARGIIYSRPGAQIEREIIILEKK